MAENKEPRDEKLIEELYERLWWYTYEASEEEFDEKEVDAITRLLDVLEPVHDDRAYEPGADAALKRFWERYGEEEENASLDTDESFSSETADEDGAEHRELDDGEESGGEDSVGMESSGDVTVEEPVDAPVEYAMEDASEPEGEAAKAAAKQRSGRRGRWRKRLIRIAIGTAACVVLLISVNVGSYALRKKSFFEIVREEVGRTEITVTGNTEEFEEPADDAVECDSWEEAEELVGVDILYPQNLPEGFELGNILVKKVESKQVIIAKYNDLASHFIKIEVDIYYENYKKDIIQYNKDWRLIEETDSIPNIQYYTKDDMIEAFFTDNQCAYYIWGNEQLDVVKEVVNNMA